MIKRRFGRRGPLVSVLRIEGIIQPGARPRQGVINDAGLARLVERAFERGRPKAVALAVNCPGGSPVQASLIGARIRRAADKAEIPVYAFVEDLAASGGYWIVAAADKIYADASSIIGSIGVISGSFGFHELLRKTGIERRLYTAGTEKSLLDPFLPQKPEDIERIRDLQKQIHDEFIAHVKTCRGAHLSDEDVFTGRFWLGERAVELGLIDEIGHLTPVMTEMFGEKIRFRQYGLRNRLLGSLGIRLAEDVLTVVEERIMRAGFGR